MLLADAQYGFWKKRATVHSAAQLINSVNKKLDSKIPTLAVLVDFKKAFDCVQHPVLLKKTGLFEAKRFCGLLGG